MTVTITLYDIPIEVRDELAKRAARCGLTLEEFVRADLINLASAPKPAGPF